MPNLPNKVPARVVIYAKDVERITGRKPRSARQLLQKIKQAYGKMKHEFVSVKQFSEYTGIEEELVREFLRD